MCARLTVGLISAMLLRVPFHMDKFPSATQSMSGSEVCIWIAYSGPSYGVVLLY